MYHFLENFTCCNAEKQPYSVENENYSRYHHKFGNVVEEKYVLICNGGRHFFKMPKLKSFHMEVGLSYLSPIMDEQENSVAWTVYFGYDRELRCGYRLFFAYCAEQEKLQIWSEYVNAENYTELQRFVFQGVKLLPEQVYTLELIVDESECRVVFGEISQTFQLKASCGVVGISRENAVEGIVISKVSITSHEDIPKVNMLEKSLIIPVYDGGKWDYHVKVLVDQYQDGLYEITCQLSGGVANAQPKDPTLASWTSEYDQFKNPYIRFLGNCEEEKLFLKNGKLTFVDNVNKRSPLQKKLIHGVDAADEDKPFVKKFYTYHFSECKYIVFGYDWFKSFKMDQEGDHSEFVFNLDEELVYYGRPLENKIIISVHSPEDKAIVKLIEEGDFRETDKLLAHMKTNHYFTTEEAPRFFITINHSLDDRFLRYKVYLTDAYFKRIQEIPIGNQSCCQNELGFQQKNFEIQCPKMPQGIYHVAVECMYGQKPAEEHISAFEVLDATLDISPQESSGLPMLYVGDGALQGPWPWSIKPDLNIIHYLNTILCSPQEAEAKKVWELLSVLHKKLAVWYNNRTVGQRTYKEYQEAIKHADYINYCHDGNMGRRDIFALWPYQNQRDRDTYNGFVESHPQFGLQTVGDTFTMEHLKALEVCFDEWTHYYNAEREKLFDKEWGNIKALNPKIKQFGYGPYPNYGSSYIGGAAMKWFGYEPEKLGKIHNGFLQFEDYPFCCAYPSHYGAWCVMTIKLLAQDCRMAPELYDSFDAGCPDGHVGYGRPPLSLSYAPPYQTVTQMYEYLYNSVYYANNRFTYWLDQSFNVYGVYNFEPHKRYREILSAWGKYLDNKPKKPLKTIAYLYKMSEKDDRFQLEKNICYNMSDVAMYYLYGCARASGIPAGFATNSLEGLTPELIDMLVIPSTEALSQEEIKQIRALYRNGVKLFAVSDVSGLEDIFGVQEAYRKQKVTKVCANGKTEGVHPIGAEFKYTAANANCVITTDVEDCTVLFENDGCALLNVSVSQVGMDTFYTRLITHGSQTNVSKIMRAECTKMLSKLSAPVAAASENCGINVFTSEDDDTLVLLTDYTPYTCDDSHEVTVMFHDITCSNVLCLSDENLEINTLSEAGSIRGFIAEIKPRQTLLFKLENA